MAVSTITLTPAGSLKLVRAIEAARQGAEIGLARELQDMRAGAAEGAPSPDEEAALLSRGTTRSGRVLGTPEGGRFIRQGDQVPLREAILTDPIVVQSTRAGLLTASTGNPARINARTGFFWMTRSRGIQGPTLPFNRAWLEAVEFGGVFWIVTPRPGTRALEPEPGMYTQRMSKTVRPYQMYFRSFMANRTEAAGRIGELIRAMVRQRTGSAA